MVGVLIRMKLAVMRRTVAGPRAGMMVAGGVLGVAAALGTIAVATLEADEMSTVLDLLGIAFATWVMGWLLAPAYGGQPVLRVEQFALLPIAPRKLALGLLGSGFVSVSPVITLAAFAAMVVFAARLGAVPVVVALPGLVLQLALVVVLARVSAWVFGALSRSRVGGAISAVLTAVMLVVASSGWIVFVALDAVLSTGFSDTFSTVIRALPSSWALVAVEASSHSDWGMAAVPLLGLALLVAALVQLWSRMLGRQQQARPVIRGSGAERAAPRGVAASGATMAVVVKELRSWRRDPVRLQSVIVAPTFALMTCSLPLFFHSTAFLAFTGGLTALMGAVTSTNLYGQDGTALWLTLLTPSSERADVRGRQLAWLGVFGPMTAVLTVAGVVAGGEPELWPWALAGSVALLGGGAGLLPAVSIDQLVPGPDPREHRDAPLDHGDLTGPAFVMMVLVLGTALPALGAVILGASLDIEALRWLGVPVGLLTAIAAYVLLGRAAYRSLAGHGPELLYLMRAGREHRSQPGEGTSVLNAMPKSRRRLVVGSVIVGCIALFPQALVPTLMKASGDVARVWFLALYMPENWQWPTIVFMLLLGVGALMLAWRVYAHEKAPRRRQN